MSDLQKAAQAVLDEWFEDSGSVRFASLMMQLENALAIYEDQKSEKYFCPVCNHQEMVRAKFDEESG